MPAHRLRILTLNTWKNDGDYPARLAAMTAGLRALDPDILLLQEAFRLDGGTVDTAAALARELRLHLAFAPARAKPRLWAGVAQPSVSGLALLARWPLRDVEPLALPSDEPGGERIALLAAVAHPAGAILAACTHLSHLRGDADMRARQLAALLASPRWRDPAAARLIGGDFNAPPDSPELDSLARHEFLDVRDVWALAGGGSARATHPLPPRPGRASRCIDFLLSIAPRGETHPRWRHAQTTLSTAINGVFPSDHAAVLAELDLTA